MTLEIEEILQYLKSINDGSGSSTPDNAYFRIESNGNWSITISLNGMRPVQLATDNLEDLMNIIRGPKNDRK